MAKDKKETEVKVAKNILGKSVLYYKEVGQTTGKKLTAYPAIISSFPASQAGFQQKDFAVDLTVFGQPSGAIDVKYGVMYSDIPAHGRWTENKDL